MTEIAIEPHVDAITMPENLRVGLMISEHRKKCSAIACSFDYYGFSFGQSPFQVPLRIQKALAENTDKGHYSAAQGIPELREAIAGFNKRHFGLGISTNSFCLD